MCQRSDTFCDYLTPVLDTPRLHDSLRTRRLDRTGTTVTPPQNDFSTATKLRLGVSEQIFISRMYHFASGMSIKERVSNSTGIDNSSDINKWRSREMKHGNTFEPAPRHQPVLRSQDPYAPPTPYSDSNCATFRFPLTDASWNGVLPCALRACTFAPRSSNNCTTSTYSLIDARCNGVS